MKTKYKTKNNSLLSAFLTGNCIGLFIFGIFASIFAIILTKKDIFNETVRYFLLVSAFFATFASSFYPARKTKIQGFLVGTINGLIISVILILILRNYTCYDKIIKIQSYFLYQGEILCVILQDI